MSRSRRKNPICGFASAPSEKDDKQIANRSFRRKTRAAINAGLLEQIPQTIREVSDTWCWGKDGKHRFDPVEYPKGMRK